MGVVERERYKVVYNKLSGIVLLTAVVGCSANSNPSNEVRIDKAPDSVERVMLLIIAEHMNLDASEIPMDKPISDPPIKADELDLIEIVMSLEERCGVQINDKSLEPYLGDKLGAMPRITPNQLVAIVRKSPKLQPPK